MQRLEAAKRRLAQISDLTIFEAEPLAAHTRFGIGGPADLYIEVADEAALMAALNVTAASGADYVVIGSGTNLVVSDAGFRGIALRFTADTIRSAGGCVEAYGGAELQRLVDYTIDQGLRGIETMTGIPGSVGAAVYGNAGAYGHSIMERVERVRFYDGSGIRVFGNAECEFHYRESVFKRHKNWIILSVELAMDRAPAEELRTAADAILKIRNEKYPPTMKCAGSIFKNLIFADLAPEVQAQVPARVIREGKVPSAWFLEEVGAKGLKNGDIHVAEYHANLIYNAGTGIARELRQVISDLKRRVQARFGLLLEEEVQYVGFDD